MVADLGLEEELGSESVLAMQPVDTRQAGCSFTVGLGLQDCLVAGSCQPPLLIRLIAGGSQQLEVTPYLQLFSRQLPRLSSKRTGTDLLEAGFVALF